jgi:LPXTG-motif cell wall-anchored protein
MDNVVDNGSRWRTLIGLVSMVAGALFLVGTIPGQAAAGPGGPPGNNGTVKIDGTEFDSHPDNEPHVGCVFQVDFYGYDEGQLFADVTFKVHPPTGNEVILEDDDIFIGEDDNSGGGSEAGLDASRTYDLTSALANFAPHPQQGWHVKLTVNADGSQGADVKHKTFWVTGCQPPTTSSSTTSTTSSTTTTTEKPTTSTTSSTTSTTEQPTSTTESTTTTSSSTTSTTEQPTSTTESTTTTSSSTTSTTEKPTTSTTSSTTSTTEQPTSTTASTTTTEPTSTTASTTTTSVVPVSSTATSVTPSSTTSVVRVAGGRLPDTGSDNDGLLAVAGLALLLGGAALFASTKVARPTS